MWINYTYILLKAQDIDSKHRALPDCVFEIFQMLQGNFSQDKKVIL